MDKRVVLIKIMTAAKQNANTCPWLPWFEVDNGHGNQWQKIIFDAANKAVCLCDPEELGRLAMNGVFVNVHE